LRIVGYIKQSGSTAKPVRMLVVFSFISILFRHSFNK
jgi:hypothetical protein